ncbi:hypothetical protein GCM10009867_24290 [Pedococcus aerophilus]|uniref:DUF3592 domain-containing protein n=1 Tax=Pedococcus aerophilus TaxID=436356 RepID=A0ABP6H5T9_9MICO
MAIQEWPEHRVRRPWPRWVRRALAGVAVVSLGTAAVGVLSEARWWSQPDEQAVVVGLDDRLGALPTGSRYGCRSTILTEFAVAEPRSGLPGTFSEPTCEGRYAVGSTVTVRRLADDPGEVLLDPSGPWDVARASGWAVVIAAFALALLWLKDTALRLVLLGPIWVWTRLSRRRRDRAADRRRRR